jgi:hypothetical protein
MYSSIYLIIYLLCEMYPSLSHHITSLLGPLATPKTIEIKQPTQIVVN